MTPPREGGDMDEIAFARLVDEIDCLSRERGPFTYITVRMTEAEVTLANAELLGRGSQARVLRSTKVTLR